MAELYTEQEIQNVHLPGFGEMSDLDTTLAPETAWQTVLSLTVVAKTESGELEVMDGIRRAESNPTHPDVVSTPTGRLPRSIASAILASKAGARPVDQPKWLIESLDPKSPVVIEQLCANIEPVPERESPLPYVVGALMAGKLGCAGALELASSKRPLAHASLATMLGGFSYASDRELPTGEMAPVYEPLIMLGSVVTIADKRAIPQETESYRSISWVPLDEYLTGVREREAGRLINDISVEDEVSVCVRGLCLATSAANVEDAVFLSQHVQA
ncbi:MAG TPA: hypothetical protein VJ843_01345 [Candidatus Saccharimonadales bacterium]|nr:hypothetical protein [Candidatus Saccharimonadales bacterium]